MPNWSNRWEESGDFRMFGTSPKSSPKKTSPKKNDIANIKAELQSKSKKEIQDYYENIGGEDNLMNLSKDKMIREVIKFSKEALGMEGGRKTRRRHTRKNRTRRS
jgi:hypothetical protein